MKINVDEIKQVPKEVESGPGLGVCVYGKPSDRVAAWIAHHNLPTEVAGNYTNIYIGSDCTHLFEDAPIQFDYIDGFSPNLNKFLHIGHASNLVLAKAFQGLGIAKNTIAILGDTLPEIAVNKKDALARFYSTCDKFNYKIDTILFASEMRIFGELLKPGTGKNTGTQVFIAGDKEIVGIKSDGTTSYTYQDVALAQKLAAPTLYLTGNEQSPHFADLKKMFPHITHVGLGLVKANGVKMASREGNVIMFDDVMDMLYEQFNGDAHLAYNVLAGFILKSVPKSDKNIDMDTLSNPLNSPGLYLSYTLAKLKSAGVDTVPGTKFLSPKLQFAEIKAKKMLQPNILFDALVSHAKYISGLYQELRIRDNEDNQKIFTLLQHDLILGMSKVGMFNIKQV